MRQQQVDETSQPLGLDCVGQTRRDLCSINASPWPTIWRVAESHRCLRSSARGRVRTLCRALSGSQEVVERDLRCNRGKRSSWYSRSYFANNSEITWPLAVMAIRFARAIPITRISSREWRSRLFRQRVVAVVIAQDLRASLELARKHCAITRVTPSEIRPNR